MYMYHTIGNYEMYASHYANISNIQSAARVFLT